VSTYDATAATRSAWIVAPRYDVLWFFGGAALSLAFLGLYFAGVPVLLLWWAWLLALDGPHIGAAFTRTYVDREEWRRRPRLLVASLLLAFAAGPAALVLGWASGSPSPFQLFLLGASFYGIYHVVRQHYGFLALYKTKAGVRGPGAQLDKWALYAGGWAPYFYLLLTHPRLRVVLKIPDTAPGSVSHTVQSLVATSLIALWLGALLVALVRSRGPLRGPAGAYLMLTIGLYGLVYFAIGPLEPTYTPSNGLDQDFLLLAATLTAFHNVQYLGLVWHYNRTRYRDSADHGWAQPLSGSFSRYALACLAFSGVVYLSFACSTGVFPRCMILLDQKLGPFTANQIGLCLWWGLAIHHYYLDQRIWRVRQDPALRETLGLG
jgi:hypothetical protein